MSRRERKCICKVETKTNYLQYNKLEPALCFELRKIVEALSESGKGLLAADESPSSLDERFRKLNLENTETTRRDFREMLFSADKSLLSSCISGILLHHETMYQKTSANLEFVELLRQKRIIPGIKVDKGQVKLFGTEDEKTTQGLDDLLERCIQYKIDGCHFTKWRCTYSISDNLPSQLAIVANANVLARYATISQSARMVPILEPEILNDGDHSIEKSLETHEEVLSTLFRILKKNHVFLEGIILKLAMVLPGTQSSTNYPPEVIAEYTIKALQRTVPPAVPTIMFLSGGQSHLDAVFNLNAISVHDGRKPWNITFCFGRFLENEAMETWNGNRSNNYEAQMMFLEKAMLCSQASEGNLEMEKLLKKINNGKYEKKELGDLGKFVTSIEP